jgi:hypothetical protein
MAALTIARQGVTEMGKLKIVSVSLLGFFLTLSLAVFGLLFTVKMTALNAGFITSRIDALDVSALAEEVIDEQATKGDLPEEFTEEIKAALIDTIDRLEPVVKERAGEGVESIYDYMLAKKEDPELAYTLRNALLNSEFVASFLDEIDLSSLAETYLSSETVRQELPEELTDELQATLIDAIDRLEPLIKERVSAIAGPIFDYILGVSQSLDLATSIRNNLLDSEFVDSLLSEIDIPTLLEDVDVSSSVLDFIEEQSSEDLPEDVEYLAEYVDEIIIELEPWIREQVDIVADPVFDYLLGISQDINISVSLEPIKDTLGDDLKEKFLESPPAELAGLSQTELDQYFDEHFGELADEFPSTFDIDESVLVDLREDITSALVDVEEGLEQARQDIADALAEVEEPLEESRQYVGYFTLGYNLLIVFMLLLIAGIVLVYRQVKGACRTLAGIFITFGVFNIVAVLVARALIRPPLEQIEDIPSSLQEWIVQTASSTLTPLLVLAIVLLVVGIALLAFSIIYSRRKARMAAEYPYNSSSQENEPPA